MTASDMQPPYFPFAVEYSQKAEAYLGPCQTSMMQSMITIFEKKLHYYRGTKRTSKNLNTYLKIRNITVDSTTVTVGSTLAQSTLIQLSIQRLYNCRFDVYTTVKQTFLQSSNRRLCNRGIDACTIVDPMFLKKIVLFCPRGKHCKHQHKPFSEKVFSRFYTLVLLQIQQS